MPLVAFEGPLPNIPFIEPWRLRFVARRMLTLCAVCLFAGGLPLRAGAQDEPGRDTLTRPVQTDALRLGVLLQVVGDFQSERTAPGTSGFSVAAAWLRLSGELDKSFGYLLQANVAGTPSILDAAVQYRLGPGAAVRAGRFKVPFSRELLIYAGSIDFVNRSSVVATLAPNRDVGVQVGGRPSRGILEYTVGAFNGDRSGGAGNDDGSLLYVARVSLWPAIATSASPDSRFEIGVNAARSKDTAAPIGAGFIPAFAGTRTLWGADTRLTLGRWMVSAEDITSRFEFADGRVVEPSGWHTTAGFMLTRTSQALLRWDALRSDGLAADVEQAILGYNLWPTRETELQVNYLVPRRSTGFRRHQVLVNLQVGF